MIKRIFNAAFSTILGRLEFLILKVKWKKKNPHNFTGLARKFDIGKVTVGKCTYGSLHIQTFGNKNEKLVIGSYCSIADNVSFLLGGEHFYTGFSTYPFRKFIGDGNENTGSKGPVIVGDDVWIGYGCIILSGVTIGQGVCIAAGSVVYKDIPPYAIYGNGKVLKYRFKPEVIEQLLKFKFDTLDMESIRANMGILYEKFSLDMLCKKPFDEWKKN
ncbi:CatB-related O-acetyltransferase [Clostridium tagluense]|uniref:CatB-related O-acetyltransferase n=1 Tax=Clostridium tagluense TaxID=360422 RepID=UPI001CF3D9AE|nr:CatB-related O-acetyltransferase [Clostridium tagluense]MCB2312028.1 CatB-related O-acetyltransferase [Clostridium tagluense]MCB2316615.1 CatB-related O-acetyltransferase [Clostridium tagluense]MCB2321449.1 CatB-related O-acetyltransferase [Clostridium tagluense]MCB2326461.1 CatB-related O-acetyltransferase [Clostridium tagluense]MCB2331207.1 CatB-related O-acetyltransferase [Clostridium tagluense]